MRISGPDRVRTGDPCHVKASYPTFPVNSINLAYFEEYLLINLRLSKSTVTSTMMRIRAFLRRGDVSYQTIKEHLKYYLNKAPATYNAELKTLHRLMKYLKDESILYDFSYAPVDVFPQETPTNEQVRIGFESLKTTLQKAVYLFIATSGLRKSEMLNLTKRQVDFETRAIIPKHFTRTKRSGITFINEEALFWLKKYLSSREDSDSKLFKISDRQWRNLWNTVNENLDIRITAKKLRLWHSVELGELGVGDRYIDTFQGRAPRSTLAKHYTSRGLDRLKAVYDSAGLKIDVNYRKARRS